MASYALIAEPDPGRAAHFLALLRDEGLEGVVARDGADAQERVRQRGAPRLLITDLALPRMDGFALLSWLREQEDSASTRVIVVTAFDELRVRAWQLKDVLGIHSLLSRRATPELMRDTVKRVLSGQASTVPDTVEPAAEQERERLARIDAMRLVDEGPPEAELQQLVSEVAQAFGVPVALLSLALGDRQWFKAHVGLPPPLARDRGTPRDWSFCHHVVQGREPLVVPDATRHPVFRDNPLVREGIIGSYAGAPLRTSTGDVLGSLCVIDTRPLVLGSEDLEALRELARRVAEDLEQKVRARQLALAPNGANARQEPPLTLDAALALLRDAVQALEAPALLVAPGRRPYAGNSQLAEWLGLPAERIPSMALESFFHHVAHLTADPAATLRQLDLASDSSRGLRLTLALERPEARRVRWVARPFPVPGGVAQMLTLSDVGSTRSPREERIRTLRMDALTGLDSRREGEGRFLREVGRCRRDGLPFSLVLVDLVGLGRLNASRGYDAGDAALRDVARRLESLCTGSAFAVRWEGGTLLAGLPGGEASSAEGLRQQLHTVPGLPEVVSVAASVEGEEDPWRTLLRAQAALTRAKAEHRAALAG